MLYFFLLYFRVNINFLFSYLRYLMRASLIAQLVKNLPAMQEIPVQFLGREDMLQKR